MVPEAKLEQTEHGLVAAAEGWFTLNLRDAVWRHADGRGAVCVALDDFEGRRRAVQFGLNPFVLQPGEPMSMYHWEADQEAFLVVSGEAVLIVEGEERPLRAWDFVHCPPHTRHVIVGAGTGPCVVIAVGARERDELGFPVDEAATAAGCGRRGGDDGRRGRVRVRPRTAAELRTARAGYRSSVPRRER